MGKKSRKNQAVLFLGLLLCESTIVVMADQCNVVPIDEV